LAVGTGNQHGTSAETSAEMTLAHKVLGSPTLRLAGQAPARGDPGAVGVTLLTYLVMNLLPGDTAQVLLGANATPARSISWRSGCT